MTWRLRTLLSLQITLIVGLPLAACMLGGSLWILAKARADLVTRHTTIAQAVAGQTGAVLQGAGNQLYALALALPELPDVDLGRLLDAHADAGQLFDNIVLLDQRGESVMVGLSSRGEVRRETLAAIDYSRRPFFRAAVARGMPVWSDTFLSATSGQLSVAYAIPTGRHVVVGEMALEKLVELVRTVSRQGDLVTMIIDSGGVLVAHPSDDLTGKRLSLKHLTVVRSGLQGTPRVDDFEIAGTLLTGVAVPVGNPNWLVLVAQTRATAYADYNFTVKVLLASLLVAFVASAFGGAWIARRQSGRIAEYAGQASRIAAGDYAVAIPPTRVRELDELGRSIEFMAGAIHSREHELAVALALQRAILDYAGHAIISTGTDGLIRSFNGAAERMLGYPAADVIGRYALDVFNDPEELAAAAAALGAEFGAPVRPGFDALAARSRVGLSSEQEWHWIRRDGSRLPVLLTVTAVRDGDGQVTGFVGLAVDISARRKAEDDLRAAYGENRAVTEAVQDNLYMLDEAGRLVWWNQNVEDVTGLSADALKGMSGEAFFLAEDRVLAKATFDRVVAEGYAEVDARLLTRNGPAYYHYTGVRVLDREGRYIGIAGVGRDITERKRAEAALRASENRFRNLFEQVPTVAVQGYAADGTVRYWNHASELLYGYSSTEAIGANLLDLIIPPSMRDEVGAAVAEMVRSGQGHPAQELQLLRKDGTPVPVYSSHVVLETADRGAELYCLDVDLTDRRRAENALRASEARLLLQQGALVRLSRYQLDASENLAAVLRAVTETVAVTLDIERVSVWRYDADEGSITSLDEYARTPAQHAVGTRLEAQRYPDYFRALRENRIIAAPDARRAAETRAFAADYLDPLGIGAILDAPIHRRGAAIGVVCCEHVGGVRDWTTDEKNFVTTVADFVSLCIELHEHQLTATELRRHQEHLEELVDARTREVAEKARIIDQTHDSVVTTDLSGRVTSWNKGAERMFGHTAAEAIGRDIGFVYPPESDELQRQEVVAVLQMRGQHELEVRMLRKGGETFIASLSLSMLHGADGKPQGMIGYSLDITARKRAERLLEERSSQLAAANSELEAFAYTVSHDLRAPLRGIDGFAKLLQERMEVHADGDAQRHLQRIRNAARRMGEIITDLLALSAVTRPDMTLVPVDVTALARDVVAELARQHPEQRVACHVADGLQVRADRGLLRVALENLLGNAWKFTARSAQPVVTVTQTAQGGGRVELCIRDNGAGFDPAHAELLFKPFKRLHSQQEFEGTGVGLATVCRIIDRHGGSVRGEGAVGKGAAFYISLPDGTETT